MARFATPPLVPPADNRRKEEFDHAKRPRCGAAARHRVQAREGRRTPALNITISLGLKESAKWQFDPDAGQVSEGPFRIEQLDNLIYSFIDGVYHR